MIPTPGQYLIISKRASCQFSSPFVFAVIQVEPWVTYDGWVWLTGYQYDKHGNVVDKRTIFVQIAGLIPFEPNPQPGRQVGAAPRNSGAVRARTARPTRPAAPARRERGAQLGAGRLR